ncbi:class I SAM-dependent methyltransferase [Dietzia cinnamea]|uniref:Class I SAM-dependent methyltransferase n=1 Tax=Dietzia cinnamea TaxID=321318 RepID=A0AAW5Q6W9_9ACTN|nr:MULTISPECIES: class I SAM-dependent methyltransferase [Dietzia]MCT1864292.1 class I SAM-dependent methyltransferase [Dietzia cinnamea]MCT2030401.1 class I SAM-dependent methyltransferase [Dietzia cinnamea]MCT2033159.1 class I SAM-dependent methyltransferase [Dietzia cinnamea]MCT2077035.1 class I SAM-dependent methyltransferase [Dietzia cinnamea]MCT2106992.1 class I SAM-dependent methyltransferase [Dietzia cinnamea]
MAHEFDRRYWDRVWSGAEDAGSAGDAVRASAMATSPPNPHLVREIAGLSPGAALEAGCGAGAEALWLASSGWRVTGVDLAAGALEVAARRAEAAGLADRVTWLEADLSVWEPGGRFDLVTTHYAHPSIPQLDFYERLAGWVAPGGTLFIVGHLHHGGTRGTRRRRPPRRPPAGRGQCDRRRDHLGARAGPVADRHRARVLARDGRARRRRGDRARCRRQGHPEGVTAGAYLTRRRGG